MKTCRKRTQWIGFVPISTLVSRMQMKKKTGSREKILRVASDLFHAQGVHATGLDEILQKSGTGKGQFYHYFKNKDDLVHQVLGQFFFQAQKAGGCARSCPIATIGADIGDRQALLRRDVCGIFDWTRASLCDF